MEKSGSAPLRLGEHILVLHCANILKYSPHYTAGQIIYNNVIVSANIQINVVLYKYVCHIQVVPVLYD